MDYSELTEKVNELEKLKQRLIWLEKTNHCLAKEKEMVRNYIDSAHDKVAKQLQSVIKTLRSTYKYKKEKLCLGCGSEKEPERFIELKKLSGTDCEKLVYEIDSVGNKLSGLLFDTPLNIKNKL